MGIEVTTEQDGTLVVTDDRKHPKRRPHIKPPWKDDGIAYAPARPPPITVAVLFGPDVAEAPGQPAASTKEITHVGEIVEHVKLQPAGTGDEPLVFEWKGGKAPSVNDVVESLQRSTPHPFAVRFSLSKA